MPQAGAVVVVEPRSRTGFRRRKVEPVGASKNGPSQNGHMETHRNGVGIESPPVDEIGALDQITADTERVELHLRHLENEPLTETACFFCGTALQQRPMQYECQGDAYLVTAELPGYYCGGCEEEYPNSIMTGEFYAAAADAFAELGDRAANSTRRLAAHYQASIPRKATESA